MPYKNGFLALSLSDSLKQIPIVNSDLLFMLFDLELDEQTLKIILEPFNVEFPDGLLSDVGNFIATAAMAPSTLVVDPPNVHHFKNYLEMFNNK